MMFDVGLLEKMHFALMLISMGASSCERLTVWDDRVIKSSTRASGLVDMIDIACRIVVMTLDKGFSELQPLAFALTVSVVFFLLLSLWGDS